MPRPWTGCWPSSGQGAEAEKAAAVAQLKALHASDVSIIFMEVPLSQKDYWPGMDAGDTIPLSACLCH